MRAIFLVCTVMKRKSTNSDGQQFYQSQENKQPGSDWTILEYKY